MRRFRSNKNFVSVTCEVGNKGNRRLVLADDAASVFLLSANHILKKYATGFCMMMPARTRFSLDRFEDEVGGVDLAVRVWVRNAHCFAFVFKDQDVIDLFASAKFSILVLPHFQQIFDRTRLELCQCEAVMRAVANHACDSCRGLIAINARWWLQCRWCFKTDARMIVVEDEGGGVVVVSRAADACVSGTEVTIRNVFGQRALVVFNRLTAPGPVLPVSGNDYPL